MHFCCEVSVLVILVLQLIANFMSELFLSLKSKMYILLNFSYMSANENYF